MLCFRTVKKLKDTVAAKNTGVASKLLVTLRTYTHTHDKSDYEQPGVEVNFDLKDFFLVHSYHNEKWWKSFGESCFLFVFLCFFFTNFHTLSSTIFNVFQYYICYLACGSYLC